MNAEHYENFPVASLLCPPPLRPAVLSIYRFARTADDIADEGDAPAAERLALLAEYRADLDAVLAGRDPGPRWHAVFAGLAAHALPGEPLHALLDAFTQDVRNPPYPDRAALLDYCRRSANPVGRLLLHLYGVADAQSLRQSDAICSALQLVNFWQDIGVDAARNRIYAPHDALAASRLTLDDIRARRDGPAARRLVAALCDWARSLMLQGAPLALRIPGRAGWELRLVVQGGLRILDKIAAIDHATLVRRPRLHAGDVVLMAWRAWRMG